MEQINYVPLLPKEPPADLLQWALEQGALNKEYLIYRSGRRYLPLEDRTEECVDVVCSGCGNEFQATKMQAGGCSNAYSPAPFGWWNEEASESVISGNRTFCPYCGGYMETKHIGSIRDCITQNEWVAVMYRLQIDGKTDRFMIADWMISRDIDKRGQDKFRKHLYSAWIVEEKKIVRIAGNKRNFYVISITAPEQRASFRDDFGEARMIYPWDPSLMKGTTAENSKLDMYIEAGGMRLVAYLGLYLKKPAVENLVMQGMAPLVKDLLDTECTSSLYRQAGGYPKLAGWIDWKEKKPAKMLGMTKEQLRIFRGKGWGKTALSMIAWASAAGVPVHWPDGVEQLMARGMYYCKRILNDQGKDSFWKTLRFLVRGNHDYKFLCDYWDMAGRLQMDLDDEQVKWPKDLRAAHDKAVERYNAQKDAITSAKFEKRVEELKHLCWEADGLLIRPCATAQELRREGKELHHCVATYADKYARGETAIFFIRRIDEPDEPFYTLELDEKNMVVRQNRGIRNCDRTEEVKEFEAAWLDWARGKPKKKRKKDNAA